MSAFDLWFRHSPWAFDDRAREACGQAWDAAVEAALAVLEETRRKNETVREGTA